MKKRTQVQGKNCGGGEGVEMGEGGQKVPTSSSKISHGSLMYSMVTVISTVYIFQIC